MRFLCWDASLNYPFLEKPNSEKTKQLFASLHERLGKRESKASENNKREPVPER